MKTKWWFEVHLELISISVLGCRGYISCTLQILFLRDGNTSKDRSHSVPLTTVHTTGGSSAIAISGTHLSSPSVSFLFLFIVFRFIFLFKLMSDLIPWKHGAVNSTYAEVKAIFKNVVLWWLEKNIWKLKQLFKRWSFL